MQKSKIKTDEHLNKALAESMGPVTVPEIDCTEYDFLGRLYLYFQAKPEQKVLPRYQQFLSRRLIMFRVVYYQYLKPSEQMKEIANDVKNWLPEDFVVERIFFSKAG